MNIKTICEINCYELEQIIIDEFILEPEKFNSVRGFTGYSISEDLPEGICNGYTIKWNYNHSKNENPEWKTKLDFKLDILAQRGILPKSKDIYIDVSW